MEREVLETDDQISVSSTEVEERVARVEYRILNTLPEAQRAQLTISDAETKEDGTPVWLEAEPQLFLRDDWVTPVEVMKKPCPFADTPREATRKSGKELPACDPHVFECMVWVLD